MSQRAGMGRSPEDRRFRHRYWLMAGIELWIAFASVLAAVGYFIEPASLHDLSLGKAIPGLIALWNAGYLIGAASVVAGILGLRPSIEVLGLGIYSAAALANGAAVVAVHGVGGGASSATLFGFAVGAACRGYALLLTNRRAVERAKAEGRL